MKVNYKSIDKKLFCEFICHNFDQSETGLLQERDQKRWTQVKIYIFKVFYRKSNKKRLEDFTGTWAPDWNNSTGCL